MFDLGMELNPGAICLTLFLIALAIRILQMICQFISNAWLELRLATAEYEANRHQKRQEKLDKLENAKGTIQYYREMERLEVEAKKAEKSAKKKRGEKVRRR